MTEVVLDWVAICDAIETELVAVKNYAGKPAFVQVLQGEPIGLPIGGPYCCFWYSHREDSLAGPSTLGNVMYAAIIEILCLWPAQPERATQGYFNADIATVDTNIRRALRANSTVNSTVNDLSITGGPVTYGDLPVPGGGGARAPYRVLPLTVRLENLEGEAIAA